MTIAIRGAVAGGIAAWVLGSVLSAGAGAGEPDPHSIYHIIHQDLQRGDLESAAGNAAKLRELITRHPEWDPDRVFAKELLPPLAARLDQLRRAAAELDTFTRRALEAEIPPPIGDDLDPTRAYGDWAVATIDKLRAERDALIGSALPAADDRALLARTESYGRSQQLLDTEILRRMRQAVEKEIERRPQDRRLQTMHDRLDQIKKGVIASAVERDRVGAEMKGLRDKLKAYEDALLGLLLEGGAPASSPASADSGGIAPFFGELLDREIERTRSQAPRNRQESVDRRKNLERYRLFNRVLADAGLIDDQTERLDRLAAAIETPAGRKWSSASFSARPVAGFLVAAAIALTWMIARHRRRGMGKPLLRKPSSEFNGTGRDKDGADAA
jgi:hypothetical protein